MCPRTLSSVHKGLNLGPLLHVTIQGWQTVHVRTKQQESPKICRNVDICIHQPNQNQAIRCHCRTSATQAVVEEHLHSPSPLAAQQALTGLSRSMYVYIELAKARAARNSTDLACRRGSSDTNFEAKPTGYCLGSET